MTAAHRFSLARTGLALTLALASTAYAACPTKPGRFVANGAEVTDTDTSLVWQRCSVGQTWSGSTCTGTASTMTHEAALTTARDSTGGWRLPNVKELASLADKGCSNPAIDSTAFPATPLTWYWSATPYAGDASGAWGVFFGNVYGYNRNGTYAVRLVRASQ